METMSTRDRVDGFIDNLQVSCDLIDIIHSNPEYPIEEEYDDSIYIQQHISATRLTQEFLRVHIRRAYLKRVKYRREAAYGSGTRWMRIRDILSVGSGQPWWDYSQGKL